MADAVAALTGAVVRYPDRAAIGPINLSIAPGEIVAAAPPPLAKVKQLVLAQYKLNAGNVKAKALAEQIQAKVASAAIGSSAHQPAKRPPRA